jgi:hypothetical protein
MLYVAVRMRRVWTLLVVLTVLMAGASTALAHPERQSFFPDASKGSVPKYKHTGAPLIVCKSNSKRLIRRAFRGKARARTKRIRLRQLKKCHYRHIQSAVNAAKSNDRIQIMPGVYKEAPSRKVSINAAKCASMFETPDDGDPKVATYEHQMKCPNARNLIAVIGDSLSDPRSRVRPEVQPPDAGHGPRAQGRHDRG